jgi:hypothetical protein
VKLVRPEKKNDFALSIFFSDFEQRVVGKAYFLLRNLVRKDLEFRVFPGNSLKHGKSILGLEKGLLGTKRRMIGGTKEQGVETGLINCLGCERKMSVMDWVEGTTEKTDPGEWG